MKKMTRILALALALALVLGMTAFAGTPSKLVLKDDFSDASDLSFDTFGQTRTQISSFDTSASLKFSTNIDTSGEPLTYKKYYAQGTNANAAAALLNVNGQIRFGDAAPSFDISISAAEGLSASGSAVTAADAAGKTVYFTANAENITGRDVTGVLVIGVFDAEGNLVKYSAKHGAYETGASNSLSAAFKLAEGQTVKAFVKDTASEITFQ